MHDFKIKLGGDLRRDRDKCSILKAHANDARVRADANNLWRDANSAITYLRKLGHSFWAIEEPVRASDFAALTQVSSALDTLPRYAAHHTAGS